MGAVSTDQHYASSRCPVPTASAGPDRDDATALLEEVAVVAAAVAGECASEIMQRIAEQGCPSAYKALIAVRILSSTKMAIFFKS